MNPVVPASLGTTATGVHHRTRHRLAQHVQRLVQRLPLHVPGQYSVSKLDALHEYLRTTSKRRTTAEILAAPIPSLVTNLLLESIPLADPDLGWRHSFNFMARYFVTMTISSVPPIAVKCEYIPEYPVSTWKKIVLNGLLQSTVGIATIMIIIAAADIFPLPFSQFISIVPMTLVGRLSAFRPHFATRPDFHRREQRVDNLLGVEYAPVVIYPMFAAIFMVLSPAMQMWFSAFLPLLKIGVRTMLAYAGRHDVDVIGVFTSGAGHLYHVLFVATCLQNSKSLNNIAMIAVFNIAQMAANANDISRASNSVLRAWEQVRALDNTTGLPRMEGSNNLIALALELVDDNAVRRVLHVDLGMFLSTYKRYQRPEFVERHRARLVALSNEFYHQNQQQRPGNKGRNSISARKQSTSRYRSTIALVFPVSYVPPVSSRQIAVKPRRMRTSPNLNRRRTTLQHLAVSPEVRARLSFVARLCSTLHQTEMIMLRSYITIAMLLFYAVYLAVVFWFPNRRYFITMTLMTSLDTVSDTIENLLLLCALEGVFFVIYLVLMQRHLGVSGTAQLAFVLSSQRTLFQAKCILLPVIILAFPLMHYGNHCILRLGQGASS